MAARVSSFVSPAVKVALAATTAVSESQESKLHNQGLCCCTVGLVGSPDPVQHVSVHLVAVFDANQYTGVAFST